MSQTSKLSPTTTKNDSRSHFHQGQDSLKKGDLDRAIDLFQKSIELDPEFCLGYYNLGLAFQEKSCFIEAYNSFKKALEIEPNNARVHYVLGNSCFRDRQFDRAIEGYERAIELGHRDPWCYSNLGHALVHANLLEESVAAQERAIELNPNLYQAYHRLGIAFQKLGQVQQSIAAYQQAIQINPSFQPAYQSLATTLVKQSFQTQPNRELSLDGYIASEKLGEALLNTTSNIIPKDEAETPSSILSLKYFCQSLGEALVGVNLTGKDSRVRSEKNPENQVNLRVSSNSAPINRKPEKLFFDKTISLGSFCLPTHQIRRNLNQHEAYLLDWWVTPHQSLLKLVNEKFSNLFDRQNLEVRNSGRNLHLVFDKHYGHYYNHDFPRRDRNHPELVQYGGGSVVDDWLKYLPQAVEKYEFLRNRWQETLSGDRNILFVRVEYNWTPQKAREIRDLILNVYPNIQPHFLLVGEASNPHDFRQSWNLDRITTLHMPPPSPLNPPVPEPGGQMPPMNWCQEYWGEVLSQLNDVDSLEDIPSVLEPR